MLGGLPKRPSGPATDFRGSHGTKAQRRACWWIYGEGPVKLSETYG